MKKILNKTFSLSNYKKILRTIFGNQFDEFGSVKEEMPEYGGKIEQINRIGSIDAQDEIKSIIPVFEIQLGSKSTIQIIRNRVGLRQIVKKLMNENNSDAAIAAFWDKNQEQWRLSFIKSEEVFNSEGQIIKNETAPKRYTFAFGPDETVLTALERLKVIQQSSKITIKVIEDAFSVEKVSDAFFEEYNKQYRAFCDYLEKSDYAKTVFNVNSNLSEEKYEERTKAIRDFVKKMLGRIVFLYFVQKKGWLGVQITTNSKSKKTNWGDGNKDFMYELFKATSNKNKFYSEQLTNLFFNGLNNPDEVIETPWGTQKVPFLNGGLFENDFPETNEIEFKPSLFQDFFDFLGQFNFTIDENNLDEHEIGINPEMLGFIFENLLEDNKNSGTYYTPAKIVKYMCQQAIIEYLNTKLNIFEVPLGYTNQGLFQDKPTAPKGQLSFMQTDVRDNVQRSQLEDFVNNKKANLFIREHAQQINDLLDNVKICDPSIGSGAFPMGLLHEIFNLKVILFDYVRLNKSELFHQQDYSDNFSAKTKMDIIEKSIYGVDIEKGAVDIARLRFWLSLVVDENEPQPLPNLDYKIVVGNSLVPMFRGKPLSIEWDKKFGVGKKAYIVENIKIAIKNIIDLQKDFFNKQSSQKKEIADEIKIEKIKLLINQLEFDREKYKEENEIKTYFPTDRDIKKNQIIQAVLDDYDKDIEYLETLKDEPTKPLAYFDWKLDFPDILNPLVLDEKTAGFDIIIGNPPYVRADNPKIAPMRKAIVATNYYKTLWEKWDLIVPFYERSLNMLKKNGVHSFIVSNSITTSKYAQLLQDWLLDNFHIHSIDYFENVKTFDAGVVPVITIISNHQNGDITYKKIRKEQFGNVTITEVKHNKQSNLKNKVFKKYFSDIFFPTIPTDLFGDICYISKGIVPNADEKTAKGLFTKDDLISDIQTERCPKPYVEGKMIDAYLIEKVKYFEWNTSRVPKLVSRPTFPELYEGQKILRGRVTKGTYDDTGILCNDSIVVFKRFVDLAEVHQRSITGSISKNNLSDTEKKLKGKTKKRFIIKRRGELEKLSKEYDLKYLLAVINSTYAMAYMNNFRRHRLKNYFYPDDFRNFPIPKIDLSEQVVFSRLVDYVIFLKTQALIDIEEELMPVYFEQIIDGLVYELYFEDILKENDRTIREHLGHLPAIDGSDKEKMQIVKEVFNRFDDLEHPIRNNLFYLTSIPEIKEIEDRQS